MAVSRPADVGFTPGKQFKTYPEQVQLLLERGLIIDDQSWAIEQLQRVNYYRLSGYWYPFRKLKADGTGRSDVFIDGSALREVVALYDFDAKLRTAAFASLAPLELGMRAMLGYELGKIDPYTHLRPELLGAPARGSTDPSALYMEWRVRYDQKLEQSREDFVNHHRVRYNGKLPVWAAVEVLDWGQLARLYTMAPSSVRDSIAESVDLQAPQLGSWMRCLNIVRNYSAHHGRMFNRVYTLTPRLPRSSAHRGLIELQPSMNRVFGQLTLVQYLLDKLHVGNTRLLPAVLLAYPDSRILPITHMGAPENWNSHPLWSHTSR